MFLGRDWSYTVSCVRWYHYLVTNIVWDFLLIFDDGQVGYHGSFCIYLTQYRRRRKRNPLCHHFADSDRPNGDRIHGPSDQHPIDSRYAVKLTGQEMYIDAKDKRNINNYANQSCNPNCVLQQWRDKKEKEQVSIVSISEILEGAEESVDCADERRRMFEDGQCNCPKCFVNSVPMKTKISKKF